MATRPPLPPFTRETAIQKVRLAEDGWNSRDPEKVALAYALDSRWRNRSDAVYALPRVAVINQASLVRGFVVSMNIHESPLTSVTTDARVSAAVQPRFVAT